MIRPVICCLLLCADLASAAPAGVPRCPAPAPRSIESFVEGSPEYVEWTRSAPLIVRALGRDRRRPLQTLLTAGADLNQCWSGSTVLQVAAAAGHLEEIRMLIEHGAGLEEPLSSSGETALLVALELGQFHSANLLLDLGANPLAVDDSNRNALDVLAWPNRHIVEQSALAMEVMGRLIDAGVDMNHRVDPLRPQWTPLFRFAYSNNIPLARYLISRGADVNLRDSKGLTALDYARRKGHEAMVDLLLKAGAVDSPAPSAANPP